MPARLAFLISCTPGCAVCAGLGFCQDLNLLSSDPADVVSVCNTIYGLLLQHQRDSKFKEQLKHGARALGVWGWVASWRAVQAGGHVDASRHHPGGRPRGAVACS